MIAIKAVAIALLAVGAGAVAQDTGQGLPPVVVEGKRGGPTLLAGEWQVTLSRSTYFGPPNAPDEMRSAGTERAWRFCLGDTRIEALLRTLAGVGRPTVAGSAMRCRPVSLILHDGRVTGAQSCTGAHMVTLDPVTREKQISPAQVRLDILGRYTAERFTLGFMDRRERVGDPGDGGLYIGRRWRIEGRRLGDCPASRPDPAP